MTQELLCFAVIIIFLHGLPSHLSGLNEGSHNSRASIISGAAIGGTVFFCLLCLIVTYALRLKKRAETAAKKSDPFGIFRVLRAYYILMY